MRLSALTICFALIACGGKHAKDDKPSTGDGPPEWQRGKPSIDGRDMVPGFPFNLEISGLPEGGAVYWYRTETAPGPGDCVDDWDSVCLDIVDAELVGEGVADGSGVAGFRWDVPEDEPPRVMWYQGVVSDPENGAMTKTSVLQRHVAVPPDRVAVSFHIVDQAAGIEVSTGGNSHTGGVAWVDVNSDYLPDLFVTNSTERAHRLYLNRGNGTFVDWSDKVPKPDAAIEDAGVLFADIDNDGDQDILVVADSPRPMNVTVPQEPEGGPNLLYLNEGNGSFTEASEEWGVRDPRGWRTSCGTFGDYDRDGLIDLYLCSWAMLSSETGEYDNPDRLLRNVGGTFAAATQPVDGYGRDALVARFVDLDQDLWPELYVGNVAEHFDLPMHDPRDVLYRNDAGTLVDATEGGMGNGEDAWAAMGTTIGDVDNNGTWEFYVTDHWDYPPEPRGNPLYSVNPDGTLTDNICHEAGVCAGYLTWPANFADFDMDGWVDLWVGTAWGTHNDLVFMNRQDGTFALHAQEAMSENSTHGGALGDYDLDGDLDIFLFSDMGRSHLYEADVADPGFWIQMRLIGTTSNKSAIGAVVRVNNGTENMMRMVSGGDSAHSQSMLTQHFGLGTAPGCQVTVTWPSGKEQFIGPLQANRFYLIDEDAGVLDESLTQSSAVHDLAADTVTVRAQSNYGGRVKLTVQPMNQQLIYDAESGAHEVVLPVTQTIPPTVTIESDREGSWQVPVTVQ